MSSRHLRLVRSVNNNFRPRTKTTQRSIMQGPGLDATQLHSRLATESTSRSPSTPRSNSPSPRSVSTEFSIRHALKIQQAFAEVFKDCKPFTRVPTNHKSPSSVASPRICLQTRTSSPPTSSLPAPNVSIVSASGNSPTEISADPPTVSHSRPLVQSSGISRCSEGPLKKSSRKLTATAGVKTPLTSAKASTAPKIESEKATPSSVSKSTKVSTKRAYTRTSKSSESTKKATNVKPDAINTATAHSTSSLKSQPEHVKRGAVTPTVSVDLSRAVCSSTPSAAKSTEADILPSLRSSPTKRRKGKVAPKPKAREVKRNTVAQQKAKL